MPNRCSTALKFFYRYVHNYGIAIIIITVIIKILFYPLTYKSYKSMKEMQKIQPKMAELKEKHKNDRDAMNKAVMELYQTHKVNPLGGCLPMVVQMPMFVALYRALMSSIELRHAPFMLWIDCRLGPCSHSRTPYYCHSPFSWGYHVCPAEDDPQYQHGPGPG